MVLWNGEGTDRIEQATEHGWMNLNAARNRTKTERQKDSLHL